MSTLVTVLDPFGVWRRTAQEAERVLLAAVEEAVHAAVRQGLVERVVEEMLAGGVVDHVVERIMGGPELDRLLAQALASPRMEQLTAQALDSEGADRLVAQVLESRLIDATVARILVSDELWLVVDEVAQSPAVTEAISRQSVGFADQVAGEVGERSRKADARLESFARRLLHRRPRPGGVVTP